MKTQIASGTAAVAFRGLPGLTRPPKRSHGLDARFLRELPSTRLPAGPGSDAVVTEQDIARLPEAARRYMRFMGAVGRPRVWSFRAHWKGRFRPGFKRDWVDCEAWQYNTRVELARYFVIRMNWIGPLAVVARDTYMHGHGRMRGKLLDLIPVVDSGGPELDIGELVTYLNDAVLFAPSMLLGPEVEWVAVDDRTFEISLEDRGTRVRARVFLDERGAVTNFSTTDRYFIPPDNPDLRLRTLWTTPVSDWTTAPDGRPIPARGQAVWHFAEGPFPYADMGLVPESLVYNVRPGD